MAAKVKVTTHGGHKFNEVLKQARKGGKAVEVGILPGTLPYDDGVEVALVAVAHEFGLGGHRESGWFRSAVVDIKQELQRRKVRALARGGGLTDLEAQQIATLAVERVRDSIRAAGLVLAPAIW